METLADYGTVAFFGVQTFTTGIVRAWISFGDRIAAAQLATTLLGFVLVVLLLERWSRGRARYHHTSSRYQSLPGYRLRGLRAVLAALACGLPLLLGFLLPAAILLDLLSQVDGRVFSPRFFDLALNSFTPGRRDRSARRGALRDHDLCGQAAARASWPPSPSASPRSATPFRAS